MESADPMGQCLQGTGPELLNQNVRMAYSEGNVMLLALLGLEITVEWHAGIRA